MPLPALLQPSRTEPCFSRLLPCPTHHTRSPPPPPHAHAHTRFFDHTPLLFWCVSLQHPLIPIHPTIIILSTAGKNKYLYNTCEQKHTLLQLLANLFPTTRQPLSPPPSPHDATLPHPTFPQPHPHSPPPSFFPPACGSKPRPSFLVHLCRCKRTKGLPVVAFAGNVLCCEIVRVREIQGDERGRVAEKKRWVGVGWGGEREGSGGGRCLVFTYTILYIQLCFVFSFFFRSAFSLRLRRHRSEGPETGRGEMGEGEKKKEGPDNGPLEGRGGGEGSLGKQGGGGGGGAASVLLAYGCVAVSPVVGDSSPIRPS